jgi:outer membrane protein
MSSLFKPKNLLQAVVLCLAFIAIVPQNATAANAKADQGLKKRYVNFKLAVEKSKVGKQEQTNFEALKKQMETMLSEKEKTINDMEDKLNDPDYLDSLSPDAETELKRKYRALSQEASQQQSQYMQTLQQTNFKILEKLDDVIAKAAEAVAKKNGYHVIDNDDTTFYYDKDLEVTDEIVAEMDNIFEKEAKSQPQSNSKPAELK